MRLIRLITSVSVASLLSVAFATSALAQDGPPVIVVPGVQIEHRRTPEILPEAGEHEVEPTGTIEPDLDLDLDVDMDADEAEAAPPPIIPIPAVWAPVPEDAAGRSAYGLYLAGRLALSRGEGETGAGLLAGVERLTPEQPRVRSQAFTSALLAGDLDLAARLQPSGDDVPPIVSEAGRLVEAVRTFGAGDARAALAVLKGNPIRQPHARAGYYVQPWIAAAAGDWDLALIQPSASAVDPGSLFIRHNRALLLEHRRRYDEADAAFQALTALPSGARLFRLSYAEFLERRHRRDDALAVYDAAIAGGSTDPAVHQGRQRLLSRTGRPPRAPDLRTGAADSLTIAALQASAEGGPEVAAVYLRLAQGLAPSDLTLFRLGQVLAEAQREADARDALGRISPSDPGLYARARIEIGRSLQRDGQSGAALVELQRAAAAVPDEPEAAYLLATQLIQLDRHQDALAILNGPLLNTDNQPFEIRFIRGVAYESLDRTAEAEAELWAALQAKPDDPTVLNYLGYLWVDSGRRVTEGAAMIARALAAEPDNGNIQDSLGWAQYRQGQYETAVETLEGAVDKEPANAEINDHLGDAYWQVGRRREAGFQWNRVLTLAPDAARQAEVERKLAEGLAPPVPVSGTGV
ncbi:tetratricopeptide repeat protein [uncultured Brevundimonas sp.]|uniref:tetratricopeptide repeat protein n=1 Tax=uncultured Brevundimonas sp. TaxID=213418 RepID=UPI0030ED641D|tara:strand:+ start:64 stop:1971 length:1908 start_codon:yes stop_codon:yes gene_type:complete